jgi:hypothetical protein
MSHFISPELPMTLASSCILGASATSAPSVGSATAAATASATTAGGERQNVQRTQGGNPPANSTHGLPPRTVAAIPGLLARSSGPNNVLGVILPVQMRGQVAVPNQSTGSQNSVGNVSQPNSTYVVPQASSGGAANISSIVAQITAQVANALAANPGMVSPSVPNTAGQGPHPTTNNGAGTVSSATSGNTQLQNELPGSHRGQTAPSVQSHVTGAGIFIEVM